MEVGRIIPAGHCVPDGMIAPSARRWAVAAKAAVGSASQKANVRRRGLRRGLLGCCLRCGCLEPEVGDRGSQQAELLEGRRCGWHQMGSDVLDVVGTM